MPRNREKGPSAGSGIAADWRYVLTPAANRQLKHLTKEVQRRVLATLDLLVVGSPSLAIKKIEGEADTFRLRVGDFRIVFVIDKAEHVFVVQKIAGRKDVYR